MSRAQWIPAVAVSALSHAGLVLLVTLGTEPDPVATLSPQSSRMQIASYEVETSRPDATEPESETANEAYSASQTPALSGVGSTVAPEVQARADRVTTTQSGTETLAPLPSVGTAPTAVLPRTDATRPAPVPALERIAPFVEAAPVILEESAPTASLEPVTPQADTMIEARAEPASRLIQTQPGSDTLLAVSTPSATVDLAALDDGRATDVVASVTPAAPPILSANPQPDVIAPSVSAQPVLAEPVAQPGERLARVTGADAATETSAVADPGIPASTQPLPSVPASPTGTAQIASATVSTDPGLISQSAQAALAWSGAGSPEFDPVSLATIQSFMAPSQEKGTSVRDGLGSSLSSVPCSRLQAAFVPETGALEIRGHIPDPAMRKEVVAGIQAQIGPAIPVGDNLLVLPEPQCDLLLAVATLGLPQSTEQSDDPLVVGQAAHADLFQLVGGDALSLRFKAPDYPSFVYVDYYDSSGTVWHLLPRDGRPLTLLEPAAWVDLNAQEELASGAFLRVGPPYGQDIAVALASNSRIFDAPRPLSEPASEYLTDLTEALTRLGAAPGFKGEWFYLFVETRAN